MAGTDRRRRRSPRPLPLEDARPLLATLAEERCGVLSRAELVARGVPRWLVEIELRAGRWQRGGRQSLVTHNGPLDAAARCAVAVVEVGPRAALDGVTALQHRGADVDDDGRLHVIAPKSSNPRPVRGVRVHESRRFAEADVELVNGTRTVRAPVAAVHAALWARTDREAQFLLVRAVQERVVTAADLGAPLLALRRARRRDLLLRLTKDLLDGVRSLGELDIGRALRARGLPEPERQVVRLRSTGTQYLDCRFDAYAVTLEVDGAQHDAVEHRLDDLVRDLALAVEGDTVVRVPLVAWRLDEQRVLDALEELFASRGWRRSAA